MRIVVVEDDPALAEALQFSLRQSGYAVDWIASGEQADHALKDDCFDLVILDLSLPKVDGLEVLRRLRARSARVPVLILSGREAPDQKVAGLDLGADDYIGKPFRLDELQARVRALLRRAQGSASPRLVYGEFSYDSVERVASMGGRPVDLSVHETSMLEALVTRFGRVVSKEQLVEKLYNYDSDVSQNAIEVYIHRLRRKIDGSGVTVKTVYGRGYLLDYKAEPDPVRRPPPQTR